MSVDEVGLEHDADIGRVELLVDHRAVPDKSADPQVTLDQRRQPGQRPRRVDRVDVEPPHIDITLRQGAGAQGRRRQMVVMEVGERRGKRVRVGAGKAGAAEHQRDVVMEDVCGDAAPQQLHDGRGAVSHIDAGAAEFQDLAGIGDQRRDVVFGGRIERADAAPQRRGGSGDRCRRPLRRRCREL